MKKIIKYIGVICILFTSCQKDDLATPMFSDVTWYTSGSFQPPIAAGDPFVSGNATTALIRGKSISFMNLSQGAITNEWIIDEGLKFLKPPFKSSITDLTPYIDEAKGLSTTDATVHVLFNNAGVYNVTLKSTFKEKVTYNSTNALIQAVKVGDVWVFEQKFQVKVN